jgi:hypothetical protein
LAVRSERRRRRFSSRKKKCAESAPRGFPIYAPAARKERGWVVRRTLERYRAISREPRILLGRVAVVLPPLTTPRSPPAAREPEDDEVPGAQAGHMLRLHPRHVPSRRRVSLLAQPPARRRDSAEAEDRGRVLRLHQGHMQQRVRLTRLPPTPARSPEGSRGRIEASQPASRRAADLEKRDERFLTIDI